MVKEIQLQLHKELSFDKIELLAKQNNLLEKVDGQLETFDPDRDDDTVIGDCTLPLYYNDGSVACNFIMTGHSGNGACFRCIFICETLSELFKHEI